MDNKKTIAVLSSNTPSLFRFRIDMMKEFIHRGYIVHALGDEEKRKWKDKFYENGITYNQIFVNRNGLNPLQDKKTYDSIKEKLRLIKPDKIFTYQAKTIIYGSMAANSLGITEVYPLIAGLGSVFLMDNLKAKVVRMVLTSLYRCSMKKCPAVFFQNDDDVLFFKKHRIIDNQKVVLIHGSGVNTERFTVFPLPQRPAFLCISRLIKDKGIYEYLEACKKIKNDFPEIRCLLVGPYDTNPSALTENELKPYVDAQIIEFYGEQEDVRPFIRQSSVFVLPSYREGTPKANLEAMACGRAVITTDTTGCRETVSDGENGFLVPVKDINAIYEKMKLFLIRPDLIKTMGLQGRRMIEADFDVKKVNSVICKTMKL